MITMVSMFKLTHQEKKAILVVSFINFFVQFPVFLEYTFSADDMAMMHTSSIEAARFYFDIGRYVDGMIAYILGIFSLHVPWMRQIPLVIGNLLIMISGIFIGRMISVQLTFYQITIALLLLTLHPYWLGALLFNSNFASMALGYFSVIFALWTVVSEKFNLRSKEFFIPILIIIFGISCYQISINVAFLISFLGMLGVLKKSDHRLTNYFCLLKNSVYIKNIFICFTAGISYFLIYTLIKSIFGFTADDSRDGMSFNFTAGIKYISSGFKFLFFEHETSIPKNLKILLFILPFGLLVHYLRNGVFPLILNKTPEAFKNLFIIILLFFAILVSILGLTIIFVEDYKIQRMLITMPFLFSTSFLLLVSSKNLYPGFIHKSFSILILFIVCLLAGVKNKLSTEAAYASNLEFAVANRVATRLEIHKDFHPNMPLVIINMLDQPFFHPYCLEGHCFMVKKFDFPWSKFHAFKLFSGYDFLSPTPEQYQLGKAYCTDKKNKKNVDIKKGIAIFCFSRPYYTHLVDS